MADKPHILIVSQCFYPERIRINDIAAALAGRGYRVTAITGIPNYPQGKFFNGYGFFKKRTERHDGVDIIRIPLLPRGHYIATLALNYLSFAISGFFWARFTHLEADIVFNYESSPVTQALPAVWYAKRRKIPAVVYVLDPWPESVRDAGGFTSPFILRPLGAVTNYIYRKSDLILAMSRDFKSLILARGVPESKIRYWPQYAEEFYRPAGQGEAHAAEIPRDGALNLLFAGNLGKAQGLEVLPEAAAILKKKDARVRFNIMGDGRFKETLIRLIKEKNVGDCFNFIKPCPAPKVKEYMSVCDASLITLAKAELFAMIVPAKVQSSLACGVPVIVCSDGECRRVIEEAGAGLGCGAGDGAALAETILKFAATPEEKRKAMGRSGRGYFESHFEKEKLLDDLEEYLKEAGVGNVQE